MTSDNSSINQVNYFLRGLVNYWWLALLEFIGFFFFGPLILFMQIKQAQQPNFHMTMEQMISSWFSFDGWLAFYLMTIFVGGILGIVMFSYLHNSKQVNFYHSQPVKRSRLYLYHVIQGLLILAFPVVLNSVIMVGACFLMGFGEYMNLAVIMVHIGRILLLGVATFAITVLAGMLTATILTHLAMGIMLHFIVPASGQLILALCGTFYKTFDGTGAIGILKQLQVFSPLCFLTQYMNDQNFTNFISTEASGMDRYLEVAGFGWKNTVILYVIIFVCLLAACALYKMRPSESAGRSMVFPKTEPVLTLVVMIFTSLIGGTLFYTVGGEEFFWIGIALIGIVTHMICQAILRKDFRAIISKKIQCGVFLVVIFALGAVLRFDLTGYDSYLPKENQISGMMIDTGYSVDGTSDRADKDSMDVIKDPEMTTKMLTMLTKVVNEKNFANEGLEDRLTLDVVYELNNGKKVYRDYYGVDPQLIAPEFQAVYESSQYRQELQMAWDLDSNFTIQDMDINMLLNSVDGKNEGVTLTEDTDQILMHKLYDAIRQDIGMRTLDVIQEAPFADIGLDRWNKESNTNLYFSLKVYPKDKNIVEVLEELQQQGKLNLIFPEDAADTFESITVYTADHDMTRSEMNYYGGMLYYTNSAPQDLSDDLKVSKTITDPQEIRQVLKQAYSSFQCDRAGAFLSINEQSFIVGEPKVQDNYFPEEDEIYYMKNGENMKATGYSLNESQLFFFAK